MGAPNFIFVFAIKRLMRREKATKDIRLSRTVSARVKESIISSDNFKIKKHKGNKNSVKLVKDPTLQSDCSYSPSPAPGRHRRDPPTWVQIPSLPFNAQASSLRLR